MDRCIISFALSRYLLIHGVEEVMCGYDGLLIEHDSFCLTHSPPLFTSFSLLSIRILSTTSAYAAIQSAQKFYARCFDQLYIFSTGGCRAYDLTLLASFVSTDLFFPYNPTLVVAPSSRPCEDT